MYLRDKMVRHLALSVNVGKGSEPRAQTPNAENVLQKICRALGVIVDVKVYKNGNFCKCENVAEQPRLSLIALQVRHISFDSLNPIISD